MKGRGRDVVLVEKMKYLERRFMGSGSGADMTSETQQDWETRGDSSENRANSLNHRLESLGPRTHSRQHRSPRWTA